LTEVQAHITGNVWKVEVQVGAEVAEGDVLVILESMKMEIPVEAPAGGKVREVRVKEGQPVAEGAIIAILD
jgi:acetyl-CoA carboxylase biotin carboxyl carrier protein